MSDADLLQNLGENRPGPIKMRDALHVLRTAEPAELNRILRTVSGPTLFDWMAGSRTALMELLGRERREALEPDTLARTVHGLQSLRRTALRDALLVEILLSRSGTALTRLKNCINTAEQHQDLEDLVYVDLHEKDRHRVLAHFSAAAPSTPIKDPKILSDIDDTVFCKLYDRRWPRRMIYPGVLALFVALDQGADHEPFDEGDLTFVTARPADAWGLVENLSRSALSKAGVSRVSVLSGSLRALVSKEAMAARKMENIARYRRLFPEYRLVFLGDSGQADVRVAEHLMEIDPAAVPLVLIHDVVGTPERERAEHAARGIHFHDTYVGAAIIAFEQGLISRANLETVAKEAVGGFERTRWDSVAQRAHMRRLFDRDLERLEAVLEAAA